MRKFILSSVAFVIAAGLTGCNETPTAPHVTTTSYGYKPAPRPTTVANSSSSSNKSSSRPTRFGQLPTRTETPSHSESVHGFPEGHPLHKEDTYSDDMPAQHQPDANAVPQSQYDDNSLPHSDMNF